MSPRGNATCSSPAPDAAIRAGRARPARGRPRAAPAAHPAGPIRRRPPATCQQDHHRCSHGRRRLRQTFRPRDLEDPHGRIERSARADRDHYFAREYFPDDVVTRGGVPSPEARYYVEAHFEDGIIEMDFVLRRDDFPGATKGSFHRSGQLRGHEEFGRALEYFRGIHGEAAIKGIKGEWGGGDNLDAFNRAFQEGLQEGSSRAKRSDTRRSGPKLASGRRRQNSPTSRSRTAPDSTRTTNVQPHRRHFPQAGRKRERERRRPRAGAADGRGCAGAGIAWQAIVRGRHRRRWSARVRPPERDPYRPRRPVATAAHIPDTARAAARSACSGGARRRRWRAGGPSVRALTPREAAGVRPEVGLASTRRRLGDLVDHGARPVPGGMAGRRGWTGRPGAAPWVPGSRPPPDHGLQAAHERARDARAQVRRGPSLAERPRPPRERVRRPLRRADVTGRTPTRPDPAQAARDLPERPPSPPPRPPAPPGGGGGGPGGGGPSGVRPLTAAQAEYFARSEAILSSPREYDHRVIVDQDRYRAAWRDRAGPQGGEPPPHGYLDQNRRAIVVYRPPADAQVVAHSPAPPPA